ncbi:CHAT domain-containing protein [Thermosynechococcaceae cyanobacterium Okahandja]
MRRFVYLACACLACLWVLWGHPESLRAQGQTLSAAEFIVAKEHGWQQEFEGYFENQFSDRKMTAKQIQRTLRRMARRTGSRGTVLHLFTMGDEIKLLVTSLEGAPLLVTTPQVPKEVLFAAMNEFRRQVSDPRNQHVPRHLESSQQLYDWLIAPLEAKLRADRIDTLLFCVGPGLRSLPWAALYDRHNDQFLIEKYHISLIPGFNLINTSYPSLSNARVLGMGASEFTDFSPLPSVPEELATIEDLWGGTFFLNQPFTIENLRQQRQQRSYPIVHLATHAVFRPGDASQSFIQLWGEETVNLKNLPTLNLGRPPVELLVLSACQTALGDQDAELGFAGLALQSGAKSALASLWSVSDAGTLALMQAFYRHLQTAPTKADALQQAQLDLLRGSDFKAPYFWSGFTLIGAPW